MTFVCIILRVLIGKRHAAFNSLLEDPPLSPSYLIIQPLVQLGLRQTVDPFKAGPMLHPIKNRLWKYTKYSRWWFGALAHGTRIENNMQEKRKRLRAESPSWLHWLTDHRSPC